jgi:tRNA pseudouridine55 synthase
MTALNGWIILDKPLGLGSTQGVGAVKRALRQGGYAKVKIGHGGTLDPLATGVLPIALGEATKLAGRMLDSDKAYDFTITFGVQTDSLDLEGTVIATSDVRPTLAEVEAVLPRFTGPIAQVPPAFSALKVDGKRAYDLARAGVEVELKSRDVVIYGLDVRHAELVSASMPQPSCKTGNIQSGPDIKAWPLKQVQSDEPVDFITLSAHVSKGTYIRSLARDIALALGTVGHVTMLRRTKAGPFTLNGAISLDILDETAKARDLEGILLPLRTALDDIPALALTPEQARLIGHGQVLSGIAVADGLHLATLAEMPVALVECLGGTITVERGFNL